jgi:glycerol-3-phosphate acyltransferase PlsY
MSFLLLILGVVFSYLLGSIPTGYIAGKVLKGVDLRKVGSGNPGTTNVYRSLGLIPAIIVFGVDMSKGLLPVLFFPELFMRTGSDDPSLILTYQIFLGLMAIAGHVWSLFLSFRGGKGVGTAFGVFLGLSPVASLMSLAVWTLVVLAAGIVSLGSLSAAVSFPIFLVVVESDIFGEKIPLFLFGSIITILVVYTHRSNILRLVRGEEKSFKKGKGGERSE